jgi:hypothetical protein
VPGKYPLGSGQGVVAVRCILVNMLVAVLRAVDKLAVGTDVINGIEIFINCEITARWFYQIWSIAGKKL